VRQIMSLGQQDCRAKLTAIGQGQTGDYAAVQKLAADNQSQKPSCLYQKSILFPVLGALDISRALRLRHRRSHRGR
jgi:hypothetical protein